MNLNLTGSNKIEHGRSSREKANLSDLNAYRRIALQLHYDLPRTEARRSVLIVTAEESPYTAFGSAALATCLAEQLGQPVLLVDACPGPTPLGEMLGNTSGKGVGDLVSDASLGLDEVALVTNRTMLSYLPAGKPIESARNAPVDAAEKLVGRAGLKYDFTVLSGGSVFTSDFAMNAVPHVGCVLLLAIENHTMREALDAARAALIHCRARKIGMVLTTPIKNGRPLDLSVTNTTEDLGLSLINSASELRFGAAAGKTTS